MLRCCRCLGTLWDGGCIHYWIRFFFSVANLIVSLDTICVCECQKLWKSDVSFNVDASSIVIWSKIYDNKYDNEIKAVGIGGITDSTAVFTFILFIPAALGCPLLILFHICYKAIGCLFGLCVSLWILLHLEVPRGTINSLVCRIHASHN